MGNEIQVDPDVKKVLDELSALKLRCYPSGIEKAYEHYNYWQYNIRGALAEEIHIAWGAFWRYCKQLDALVSATYDFVEKTAEAFEKADQESAADVAG